MALSFKKIRCRSCQRIFAVVSETGLTAEEPDAHGCDTCQQFSALHNAVLNADREWAEMQPKRDSSKSRQNARLHFMQAHMEFDNWLSGVEAPTEQYGETHPQTQESMGRALSDTPTPSCPESCPPSYGTPETHALGKPDIALSLRPSSRPSPKRSHSATSLPSRKRLKFSDSVEFRDDYRDCSEYMRGDEKYVRGRYAPPDGSEYLDTSGSAQTFLKFTGVRRVKGDWVEVTETKTASKRKARNTIDDVEMHEKPPDDTHQNIDGESNVPPTSRAMRLARRNRNSLGYKKPAFQDGNTTSASSAPGYSEKAKGKLSKVSALFGEPLGEAVELARPAMTSEASTVVRVDDKIVPKGDVVLASQDDSAPAEQSKAVLPDIELGSLDKQNDEYLVGDTRSGFTSSQSIDQHAITYADAEQPMMTPQVSTEKGHVPMESWTYLQEARPISSPSPPAPSQDTLAARTASLVEQQDNTKPEA